MKRALLYTAILLTSFTFVGHTASIFAVPPAEDTALTAAFEVMRTTPFKMPLGPDKTLMDVYRGADLGMSTLLVLCAALLFLQLRQEDHQVLRLTSAALATVSALSVMYFFPIPAIFCGLSAICALTASLLKK